ncbi:polysaccharide deacetylase family protein [Amorphoplanes nipponensis]|uniref:Polysaccharide deacetylase n=2 Tax=Actinoplanes nipponensis TaxID=135950 RepID=A0A919JC99_9ACTN|nr:polysaccharide deacetylase [Actinoplanes nipponensis]
MTYAQRWAAAAAGCLPRLLERSRTRPGVTILMYHALSSGPVGLGDWCLLSAAHFRWQMRYLRTYFEVLALSEAVTRLQEGAVTTPVAVVTFDDGFQGVRDAGLPVLREFGVPATVFLNTGFVDTGRTVWFCRIVRALALTDRETLRWRGHRYALGSPSARRAASADLQHRLKQLHPDVVEQEVGAIETQLAPHAPGRGDPWRVLSSAAIRELAGSGLVEFGAHTDTHTILTRVDADRAAREIDRSIRATRDLTGRPCELFAYPNGTAQDYDAGTTALLRDLGIRAAVTTRPGLNTASTPLLELRRDGVGGGHGLLTFPAQIHHSREHLRAAIAAREHRTAARVTVD